MAYYAHPHVNDLTLDARSQWVGKGKNSALNYLDTKQTISIKLAITVGHFYVTLTLKNVYMA